VPNRQRDVVFVHGINSKGPETFDQMRDAMVAGGRDPGRLSIYSYDYTDSLRTNGAMLATYLRDRRSDDVALVCHSMGGLVARLAVLENDLPFVKTIVMLATPNFGAMQDGQLGVLMQPIVQAGRALMGWRPRKQGILDLTRVPKIFEAVFDAGHDTTEIDYVTIPGTFFHELRNSWEMPDRELKAAFFTALSIGTQIGAALYPLFSANLGRPHDGIVTERSNAFAPLVAGYDAEKNASINRPHGPSTYAHVRPRVSRKLHHCNITHNAEIIALVDSLVDAPSLAAWLAALAPADYSNYTIVPLV